MRQITIANQRPSSEISCHWTKSKQIFCETRENSSKMSVKALKAINPPKKAKGSSKKTKKGWRKNVDISKVEEYLDEQRLEERLGGAFDERPDDDVFMVDTNEDEVEKEEIASNKWRRKRPEKPLKCYQHLDISGGVADPVKGRNRRKLPEERKNPTVLAKEKANLEQGIVK